ncbi:radial spoke head 10 homolog B isoform X1 [Takifugu rubripes]|uniref:radial spoke head 10 homolog B isoform X1 n=1 Tax=Takifugu rubripes TaxID=31033 RepID=UPI001145D8A6|nr:radial spoke head 10 homolog B isoform X1 [Takifugu rubripes]
MSSPDSLDEDSVEVELKEVDVRDRVEGLEIYMLICLTVQRYEGAMCAGQFHGEGVAYFEGGHMYKGLFSKGLMDGPGVFTHADGLKYEGEFVSNLPMGQGIYTWLDGSTYEGQVCHGLRHGMGTYTCLTNGVVHTGQWSLGGRHGKGTTYYNQEKTSWYKGDWVRNRKQGWGVRCYPSGNLYSGEWRNNLRHGEGTMRWINLHQQYVGMWQNGVQHGQGTHFWNTSQGEGGHFFLSSQYTGEFVQGQRHGHGKICFASGATYVGEWKHDKNQEKVELLQSGLFKVLMPPTNVSVRVTQGQFTSADGRVFEGDRVHDQIMAQCLNSNRDLNPLSDLTLNIKPLLAMIPATERDAEYEQVMFAVLKYGAELRSIYRFYSQLGRAQSPYSLFQLTRLQLWRLLKDCYMHHHFTLIQIDQLIRVEDEATVTEIHSPFTPIFLRQLLSLLVVLSYHLYHKDLVPEMSLLADCFIKLMRDSILPNVRSVKGFLFKQPDNIVVAVKNLQKCWEMYKNYSKRSIASRGAQTMTCRELLWMFKGLKLLDNKLTTAKLMEIITAERLDPTNLTSCLEEEITFLEFLEVLFGCAEVFLQVSESPDGLPLSRPEAEVSGDPPEAESSEDIGQTTRTQQTGISGDVTDFPTGQNPNGQEDFTEVASESQTADLLEPTEEHLHDKQGVKTKDDEVEGCEVQRQIRTVDQFFSHVLFPAFEQKCGPHA